MLLIPYGKAAVISVFLHADSKGEEALDSEGSCRLNTDHSFQPLCL